MKRAIDLVSSGLGLIVLSPVFGVLALWIKLDSRGPIFYRGVRVGRHGKAFRMFKFRSMVQNADKIGAASTPEDDPRVTRVGSFLRAYKLDELPQLLKGLKGRMGLLGPLLRVQWAVG